MSEYSLLINILNRELEDVYLEYYKASGVNAMFSCLCCGTASKSVLDYLGLEKNEKIMFQSLSHLQTTAKKIRAGGKQNGN